MTTPEDTPRPLPTPPPQPPSDMDTPADDTTVLPADRTADDEDTTPADDDGSAATLKARMRTWETRSKANHRKALAEQRRNAELQTQLDQLRDATRSEAERAVETARREEREKWSGRFRTQALEKAVLRYAGNRLADPDDALRLLQLDPSEMVGEDGSVDGDAIRAAIDDLIRTKPYLAATVRRPATVPSDQGTRPRPPDEDLSKVPMSEYMRRKYPDQYHQEA